MHAHSDSTLDHAFRHCQRIARASGHNFYFSFLTLPRPLFRDMCALYAFMRVTDDLGDDETRSTPQRKAALSSWRSELSGVMAGESPSHPVIAALSDVQQRHHIPPQYFHDVITGVEQDLQYRGFETFQELSDYCYHVAGAVGLCCIHIWGFNDPAAVDRAIDCGTAFQLTNILRDLQSDARSGRVYLPREDLQRFAYTPDDLRSGLRDARFQQLMQYQVSRAREFYRRGAGLHQLLAPPGRPILSAMIGIYGRLLTTIERRGFDVYTRRIQIPKRTKLAITASHLLRPGQRPALP